MTEITITTERLEELVRDWAHAYPIQANELDRHAVNFAAMFGRSISEGQAGREIAERWAQHLVEYILSREQT